MLYSSIIEGVLHLMTDLILLLQVFLEGLNFLCQ
jgi:hypothetical protein